MIRYQLTVTRLRQMDDQFPGILGALSGSGTTELPAVAQRYVIPTRRAKLALYHIKAMASCLGRSRQSTVAFVRGRRE